MKSQTSTSPWLNRLLKPLEGLLAGMLLAIWLVVLLQVMLRAPTAAGWRGLTRQPSGAVISIASNMPPLGGRFGSSKVLTE